MATPHSTPTIGVLLPMDASHSAAFIRGIDRAARLYGARYVTYGTTWADLFERVGQTAYPVACLGYDPGHLDGTILSFGTPALVGHLAALHRAGHPCVFALRTAENVPRIMPDDERRVAALVERLHRHGHRRFAYLCNNLGNPSAQRRLRGYTAGLERVGLPADPSLIFEGDPRAWGPRFFREGDSGAETRFSALVCFNDNSALSALNVLRARGVSVPDQVEVTGFDDLPSAAFSEPPLTTFTLPMDEIGFAAMEQMMRGLRGETVEPVRTVSPVLIQRGSTRFQDHDPLLDTAAPPPAPFDQEVDPRLLAFAEKVPASGPLPVIVDAVRNAVQECLYRGLDIDALAGLIRRRAADAKASTPADPASGDALEAVLELVRTTARLARGQAVERARLVHALTAHLRRTSFEALDEPLVIDVLRDALAGLGFDSASLHLRPVGEDEAGVLHRWNLRSGETRSSPLPVDQLPAEIARLATEYAPLLVTSLSSGGVIVGHLLASGERARSDELWEIVRYFSSALHGIRLYRQLARSHETLRETQRELVEMSRRAGVAEIATGVLHNVGNALNAVNISAGVVDDRLSKLRIESLAKVRQLLLRSDEPWGDVFQTQDRGRKLLEFLHSLETHLRQERDEILAEIQALRQGAEHINQIVASQQQFALVAGLVEEFDPVEAPDYALRLCEAELLRHGISVVRAYEPAPRVHLERHKVVQILVNLIRNAKEALSASARPEKTITVGLRPADAGRRVECYVADNGPGIAPENLGRMFTMGFSTKKGGHGFGLHNSALVASSLGGSLEARSDGPGRGATFVLTLPAAHA